MSLNTKTPSLYALSRLILLFSTSEAVRDVTDRQRRLDRELGQWEKNLQIIHDEERRDVRRTSLLSYLQNRMRSIYTKNSDEKKINENNCTQNVGREGRRFNWYSLKEKYFHLSLQLSLNCHEKESGSASWINKIGIYRNAIIPIMYKIDM